MSSCVILGYTGAVGKSLFRQVMADARFTKVTAVGRRDTGPYTGPNPGKLVQSIVDFENLGASRTVFQNHQVAFCALGTTIKIAGSEENFVKIDRDYVVNTAKLIAKESPDCHFIYVSSDGASASSMLLYFKTKGQIEHELSLIPNRVSILRPKLLETEEKRHGELRLGAKLLDYALPLIKKITPEGFLSVHVGTVAKAMINIAFQPMTDKVHLYTNTDIYAQAALSKPKPSS